MEIIVLHDKYTNEPIFIRTSAINVIKKGLYIYDDNKKEEYTLISVGNIYYDIKEHIDVVMRRINAVENKHRSRKESEVINEDKNCRPIRF